MIHCDKCLHWQHTPCAGFCSNRDKKIPEGQYTCDSCKFNHNASMIPSLSRVAVYRRSIAVLYTEGISNKMWLAKRLSKCAICQFIIIGCSFTKASNLIDKMESNGILIKSSQKGKQCTYSKKTGQEVKNKLKIYFGSKVEDIPEIVKAMKNSNYKSSHSQPQIQSQQQQQQQLPPSASSLLKKRKSLTRETVEACQS